LICDLFRKNKGKKLRLSSNNGIRRNRCKSFIFLFTDFLEIDTVLFVSYFLQFVFRRRVMFVFRLLLIQAMFVFCVTGVIGQVYQPQSNLPQQPGAVQQPIRQKPQQTPPKTVIQNGVTVYQQGTNQSNQFPDMTDRTTPLGFGSPYPTGLPLPHGPVKVAAAPSGSIYGLPPQGQPATPQYTNAQPPAIQPNPSIPVNEIGNRVHVGHAEPAGRVIPFFLTPKEQQELDEFLARWENYSLGIKRYDVDFNMFLYVGSNPHAVPNTPLKTTFGYFKYIAKPLRFAYHIEGEWLGNKKVEWSEKSPDIFAEQIIIDEKSVHKYDFNAKKVFRINVPTELIGKGIADSPLPLIFGAKAVDLKKRFSMKLVTTEQAKEAQIWFQARPLLLEDQQEFSQIEIRLDKATLRAIALKKEDINGKDFTVYVLHTTRTNDRLHTVIEDVKQFFTPATPKGWQLEVNDWAAEAQTAQPQPAVANQPQPLTEIPLYQPKIPPIPR
jgi:hypothetical protein